MMDILLQYVVRWTAAALAGGADEAALAGGADEAALAAARPLL